MLFYFIFLVFNLKVKEINFKKVCLFCIVRVLFLIIVLFRWYIICYWYWYLIIIVFVCVLFYFFIFEVENEFDVVLILIKVKIIYVVLVVFKYVVFFKYRGRFIKMFWK